MSEIQYSVEVKDVEKHFKVYMDKGSTLKERAIFHNRNRHENRQILDGISFEIPKGQAVGLIGRNGCGKSKASHKDFKAEFRYGKGRRQGIEPD